MLVVVVVVVVVVVDVVVVLDRSIVMKSATIDPTMHATATRINIIEPIIHRDEQGFCRVTR